jgi:predicted TIM-barrel fold metal-dependent hydrolase
MDLSLYPAIDQHAHNLLTPEAAVHFPFTAAFTEGHAPEILASSARRTLFYRRSLRDISLLLGCDGSESAINERRTEIGLDRLTALCFASANLAAVLLDDGFLADQILPLEWHARFVPVKRLLRLETLAQDLLSQTATLADFVDRFRGALEPLPPNVVAFKSIAAYRSGLDVQPVSVEAATERFDVLRRQTANGPLRLVDKTLIDYLLPHALEVAARHELPVQFHTGFGDADLDLRTANPLHLRPILENARFRRVPIVLLHASYPFTREAGYLASVYPQVHLDFGLAVPFLSVAGMRATLAMLLELAPLNKIMYASDAHCIPELFYLGAKWGRAILGQVLEAAVADGELSAHEANEAAAAVLAENARTLYRL